MGRNYFFLEQCPKHEECNQGRGRKKLWGWTEVTARQAIVHHLTQSSLHFCDQDEAEVLAEIAELKVGKAEEEPEEEAEAQAPPQKRSRAGKSSISRGGGGTIETEKVAEIVSAAMHAVTQPAAQGASASSAGPPLQPPALTTLSRLPRTPPGLADRVVLRRTQVKALQDSLARASHSLRQAERVTEGAMRAFRDEAMALEQVAHEIRSMLQL